jgi:C4-dicarboxylate-specific signal transduction histidine kinase
VIAILLLLVPVLIAAVWSGWTTFNERRQELGEQARIVAVATASYVNRRLTNEDNVAERLSSDPAVQALDPGAVREVFGRVVDGRAATLRFILVAPDGREIARVDQGSEPLDAGTWAANALSTGARVNEPMRTTSAGDIPYIVLGYPVTNPAGKAIAALGVYMNLRSLRETYESLSLPAGSVVTVLDLDGRIMARSVESNKYEGQLMTTVRGLSRSPRAPHEAIGLDGTYRVYGEAAVERGPWIVSVGIPRSVALQRAMGLWARSSSILALGVLGWLTVALVLSRRLGDSVGHLDREAQRIAGGDFSPMTPRIMLSRELSELQTAFGQMLRRFNDTRAALDAQMAEERRIRLELESLQGQVIRQERLAAVGQLVSGVAHEINNPLQAILGFSELLQMQKDLPVSVKTDLALIQKESTRACGIIRNLALFVRQQPDAAAALRLGDVITSVAELRQRRLESEQIRLQVDDRSTQQVSAVLTELQQVVLNFVINAEQSIVGSGRLPGTVIIRTYDRDRRVVLEVEDSGPGVRPEHEGKLFEPFFTTKAVGQGTGLGLSVSYGIIDSLNGQIGYRRSQTSDSIFYFELPAAWERLDETA